MISRLSVGFRALRRKLGRSHLAARLLGMPVPEGEADRPGLIMLQIDGLSRKQMERALEKGNLPFLSSLIRRRHFDLETFYSGVPSTTPAVQAEIFYRVRQAVPAFEFYRKESGRIVRMYEAEVAAAVEAELRERGSPPLLKDAHSYSNVYRAGATFTRYCSQDLAPATLLKRLHPLKSLILGLAYLPRILRLVALVLVEIVLAVVDFFCGLYERQDAFKEFEFIFSRVAVSIGLREMVRFRTLLDIECGVRVIHANFLGYDEQAHRRGPDSAFAHWTLKGIDRTLRDIQRAAHRSSFRDYELIVYSDHGQEATLPFEKSRGRHLEAAVAEAFSTGPLADHPVHRGTNAELIGRSLGRKRHFTPGSDASSADGNDNDEAEETIILSAMGPTGQVYLPFRPAPEELENYAAALVRVGRIPLVILPHGENGALAFNPGGRWRLPEDRAEVFGADHPFLDEVAEDSVALCRSHYAGDLTLSGWVPGGPPLSFRIENGAHGGPGSEETRGFVLLPDRVHRWHRRHLPHTRRRIRGEDLYEIAAHFLRRAGSEVERVPPRRPEQAPGPLKLRVMTYNIHSCLGLDGKTRAERVARVINEFDPDVVAVQEVDAHRPRSGRQDQPGKIAAHLRMEHAFHAILKEADERYGIAVFSRFPFELIRSDLLSESALRREARGAICLRVLPEGKRPFHFINTHFGLGRSERRQQAEVLLGPDWLGGLPEDEPVLLCGDFNSSPRSRVYKRLRGRLRDVWQAPGMGRARPGFPSMKPFLRLDHIFASPQFAVEKVEVLQTWHAAVASDHLPLCAEFTLHPSTDDADA
ncbi:MAG: endonuclease/exonuclease/phosphatase family protein [Opitutales bacterium]